MSTYKLSNRKRRRNSSDSVARSKIHSQMSSAPSILSTTSRWIQRHPQSTAIISS